MLIEVNTTWTTSNNGSGATATGTGRAFDTASKQLVNFSQVRYLALLDPAPANVRLAAGDVLWSECDSSYTRTEWVYSGNDSFTTRATPNSPYCGYAAPAACQLATLRVSQALTPAGMRVTASFSGTLNGMSQYQLDGGAEQTSPVFVGVTPGAHTLRLRDDGLSGCELSSSFMVAGTAPLPPAPTGPSQGVDFVGQPLWRTLALPLLVGALVELELWAESRHGAADFALVLSLSKRVPASGEVSFRLDPLLWPLLQAFEPTAAASGATSRCTTNLVDYYTRLTTTPLDPNLPVIHGVSELRTALRGGLPAEWQGTDYFAYRLGAAFAQPPFLSWQPTGAGALAAGQAKPITPQQPEWLFFLCPATVAGTDLRVRRSYQLSRTGPAVADVEVLPVPASGSWAHVLLAIPLRATRAGFTWLTVQVEDVNGDALSLPAAYQFVAAEQPRYLLFTNSLGGVDTVRCTDEARLEIVLEAATEKVERPARAGASAPATERQVSDVVTSRKLRLATGWRTPQELDWLQELVLSREVWHQVGAQLRPLDWSKRSLAAYSDEPGLRGLLIEGDYAYAPTAYAPTPYA